MYLCNVQVLLNPTLAVCRIRFIAGGLHPDHDTIAHFQKTFLADLKALLVQVLLGAQEAGALNLQHQLGWEQAPCGCIQEPCRQLQTCA